MGTICLILDGADGRIARRLGETSSFGGWWVVLIGLLRYLYLLAAAILPALRAPLPFSQVR
ncbi:CDP-alcohol phosphatidyltransferase family protein [Kribbella capetownensis]|uniref:CDP-alcohol phosphatidyltransferase family protein n=1 Tax=Kribbella capetownensis TaxID=1572659 RepID=UPI0013F4B472|nr:CDP-alcohol phosphatidyltransferase family protein [Kribbella capetownensis]